MAALPRLGDVRIGCGSTDSAEPAQSANIICALSTEATGQVKPGQSTDTAATQGAEVHRAGRQTDNLPQHWAMGVLLLKLPYQLRYLVALAAWALLLCGALVLKFFLVCCIPIIFLMSGFGFNQTQKTAQYNASLADLLIYGWPRFPRADWRRLLGRRGRSADQLTHPGLSQEIGNRRV